MEGIPPPLKTDAEDVVWALETASNLWKKHERIDAIVWLKRAADAAHASADEGRAQILRANADALTDFVAGSQALPRSSGKLETRASPKVSLKPISRSIPNLESSPPSRGIPDLSSALDDDEHSMKEEISIAFDLDAPPSLTPGESTETEESTARSESKVGVAAREIRPLTPPPLSPPQPPAPAGRRPPPLPPKKGPPPVPGKAPLKLKVPTPMPVPAFPDHPLPPLPMPPNAPTSIPPGDIDVLESLPPLESVPPPDLAEEVTANIEASSIDVEVPTSPSTDADEFGDIRPLAPPMSHAPHPIIARDDANYDLSVDQASKPPPRRNSHAEMEAVSLEQEAIPLVRPAASERTIPSALPADLPPPERQSSERPTAIAARSASERPTAETAQPFSKHPSEAPTDPTSRSNDNPPETPEKRAVVRKPTPALAKRPIDVESGAEEIPTAQYLSGGTEVRQDENPALDLSKFDAFSDLPDDERDRFASSATVHHLGRDEETSGFALALVLDGNVDVSATIVDAVADRLSPGNVLQSRGTIGDGLNLRVIGASDHATVATWEASAVDLALKACPWVAEDLARAADRTQALVGVTLGPLAERLDASLRTAFTDKLEVKRLAAGELIMEQGKAVPGVILVGVGSVSIEDGSSGSIEPGEFVFPAEILGAGRAPFTARAAEKGAIVLTCSRAAVQELLVTCPPLLEILAGM